MLHTILNIQYDAHYCTVVPVVFICGQMLILYVPFLSFVEQEVV